MQYNAQNETKAQSASGRGARQRTNYVETAERAHNSRTMIEGIDSDGNGRGRRMPAVTNGRGGRDRPSQSLLESHAHAALASHLHTTNGPIGRPSGPVITGGIR